MTLLLCTLYAVLACLSVEGVRGSATHLHRDSDVVKLFTRRGLNNKYPPPDVPGPTPRAEWIDALNREKAAGHIPNFKPSIKTADENVKYEAGVNGSDASICSWTIGCKSPTDITDAPAGMMGISFDDGPEPASSQLMKFLKSVNQTATHFMIGSRIQQSPGDFAVALNQGGHIAVHTWSHPLMTTLNDTAVLGEIGWTLQIIFDLSGGRLPAFWRPPFGDVDNRVRAIAKNVFGLQTVIWNQDTNDWCLTPQNTNTCGAEGPSNQAALDVEMSRFVKMPKNPGLIILEHELTTHSVHGFTHAWPSIKQAGWDTRPIPSLFNMSWYQNANGAFDQPIQLNSLLDASEVVASARARLAASSDKTSTNPPLNSTVLVSSAKKPPQVGGSTAGASYRGSTFQIITLIFVQALILARL
ncbi:hypothetical protein PSTG_02952 [Puccinia striiformis f. sp. tritici PST-78]|uniref:Chitin deacetylase 3 n=1 Tax=Puccinia striiformis f. sp. tritici PST-78 TaxID=1165861 RepID=A0A0L0VXD9_9BASI|nr:hypothetical protein PSTG_02952 [Puccinia striiformis f. sp. tritici PST-78]